MKSKIGFVLAGLFIGLSIARNVQLGSDAGRDDGEFLIDTSGVHQEENPAVAFDGTNFLVVWEDYRRGSVPDIYGARVTPEGVVLDPQGIPISRAAGGQYSPAVAFDGTNYLVVWEDWRGVNPEIYGARVTPDGRVLDPEGISISHSAWFTQANPAVAFGDTDFLVVWIDSRNTGGYPYDIYGARVTTDGALLDPEGIPISTEEGDQGWLPAVAFDGMSFLVVWSDSRSDSERDVYGARVTRDGTVLDPEGIPISTVRGDQGGMGIAFAGTDYLVVWQDYRSGTSDIYGARVTPEGIVLDPEGIPISTAAGDQGSAAVAFDGTNFFVVWHGPSRDSFDIGGARVTPDGVVLDSGVIVKQEGRQLLPALCHGTGNQMFLAYQGWTGTVGGKTYNTYRIWGKVNPSTGVQEKAERAVRTGSCGPTVVRGVLMLKETGVKADLLDAAGRRVMELLPGANDIRHLAPGVYFIREHPAVSIQQSATYLRRVVLAR